MLKRIILLCLFLSYSFFSIAQRDTTWQVGVVTAPSIYWKYNSFEFNTNGMRPISPDFPNSFIWGITLQKPLTDRWNFKTGLEYSIQSQKFIGSGGANSTPNDEGELIYDYAFNADHNLDISYLSIPLQFSYQIPIGIKEKWSFFTAQGVPVSILTNYYGESKDYKLTVDRERIRLERIIIYKPNEVYDSSYPDFDKRTYYFTDTPAYRKFVLGYSSSYGFQRKLGERFTASLATRFDFDFTNSDNVNGMLNYNTTGLPSFDDTDFSKDSRPVSHNIRIGLELGVRYSFGFTT